MKVLSLLQPWAYLWASGHKKIETRSWGTKYRGDLLIHASKGKMKEAHKIQLLQHPEFKMVFETYEEIENLQYGFIIGKVKLIEVMHTEDILSLKNAKVPLYKNSRNTIADWEKEIAFGDYGEGRYGWITQNPELFTNPIPAKGNLGLWDFNIENL